MTGAPSGYRPLAGWVDAVPLVRGHGSRRPQRGPISTRRTASPATAGLGPAHPPEATMRFYSQSHAYYCGIDLHTRTLSLCLVDAAGAVRLEATLPPDRDRLAATLAPYRHDGLVVGVGEHVRLVLAGRPTSANANRSPFVLGLAPAMRRRTLRGIKLVAWNGPDRRNGEVSGSTPPKRQTVTTGQTDTARAGQRLGPIMVRASGPLTSHFGRIDRGTHLQVIHPTTSPAPETPPRSFRPLASSGVVPPKPGGFGTAQFDPASNLIRPYLEPVGVMFVRKNE